MSAPTPDRKVLEELWRQRLNDARLRVDFAVDFAAEVHGEHPSGDIPESEYHLAQQQALRGENFAQAQYNLVLRSYTDLLVHGIIPDEAGWLKSQANSA